MKKDTLRLCGVTAALSLATCFLTAARDAERPGAREFTLRQIGEVRRQGGKTLLVMDQSVQPALLGVDEFSHLQVFWWFDKNDTPQKRSVLQVHPRGNRENPLAGVFATRSPMRPNLLALSTCKIVAVRENVVEIEDIDAFDGTPILDLKGYIPGYDSVENASGPKRR
jgi:tRNA (adenine37-N6)-methyltransferase